MPRLKALNEWLIAQRVKTADGCGLARAIDYSLKRWPALIRYLDHRDLPIDNNPVENSIRPITLGRRNWLFHLLRAGRSPSRRDSEFAGHGKAQWLGAVAWLRDTLEKLPTWPYSRIDELLPVRTNPPSGAVA